MRFEWRVRIPDLTRLLCGGVALVSTYFVFAPVVYAQGNSTDVKSPVPAVAPSYERYVSPTQCVLGLERITLAYWRDVDTVGIANLSVVLPVVAKAARECSARFAVDSVFSDEVPALAKLYLTAGADDKARVAFTRMLVRSVTPAVRAQELLAIVRQYATTYPLRKSDAVSYATRLDSLGVEAAVPRMLAYRALAERAKEEHDLPWLDAMVTGAQTAQAQLTTADRRQRSDDVFTVYVLDAYRSMLLKGNDSASAVLQRAKAVVGSANAYANDLLGGIESVYQVYGTPAKPLEGDFWFNLRGSAPTRPTPGKVSLLVYMTHLCYIECTAGYSTIRRLAEVYERQGLEITLFTHTLGFFRQRPPLSPEDEARAIEDLFLSQLKLPAALVVAVPAFDTLEDGRRKPRDGRNTQMYPVTNTSASSPIGVLVDRMGVIRAVESIHPRTERMWEALLRSVQ